MRKIQFAFVMFVISAVTVFAQPEFSKVNSMAGAFSRMGFGARGIGMGNAASAVLHGNVSTYYNPALSVFQQDNAVQTGYTVLGLDRSLNFFSFTRRFEFYSASDTMQVSRKPRTTAGISAGIINSGVSDIQERDNQGNIKSTFSTSENQFYLAIANRFSEKLTVGLSAKFYYYQLFKDISSTGFGFDIGAIYSINNNFAVSVVLSDINSKYKWDTAPLYGTSGTNTTDDFPFAKKLGISYYLEDVRLQLAAEIVESGGESTFGRFGAEYNIYDKLYLRCGVDGFDFTNSDNPVRPAAGFSYSQKTGGVLVGIDYAFVSEAYGTGDRHVIGLHIVF